MPGSPVLRLRPSRAGVLAVVFLLICVTPLAGVATWLLVLYVIPIAVLAWILRVGTDVDSDGLTVRAIAGHRRFRWEQVAGLSPTARGELRAVLAGGRLVRLPCARLRHLDLLAEASGGRLPRLPDRGEPPQQPAGPTPTA